MTVIAHALDSVSLDGPSALTIGTFDGVHVGHQALIRHVIGRARILRGPAVLVTFRPHPRSVLRPHIALRYLQSTDERLAMLSSLGLDHIISLEFDMNLARTGAAQFAGLLARNLGMRELWVGRGFALGRNRKGDVPFLTAMGSQLSFTVHPIRRLTLDDEPISSSTIRNLLSSGEVRRSTRLLGRYYRLTGAVVHGAHRGAQIGFPTANLAVPPNRLVPANGVYATWVRVAGRWVAGATNIGTRPTFANGDRTVETHLLDWQEDVYGRELVLSFVERLRNERKFAGREELTGQLRRDVAQVRELLSQTAPIMPVPELPAVEQRST